MQITKQTKLLERFIKPFRMIPPFEGCADHEKQTLAILVTILQQPAILEALQFVISDENE